jgi:hypothetical protein
MGRGIYRRGLLGLGTAGALAVAALPAVDRQDPVDVERVRPGMSAAEV